MSGGCQGCRSETGKIEIAMAFQPIVDVQTGLPFAYEALVRGINGEPAGSVLAGV
ncbi:MAG: diguanylate phosphodiesterase, partial [Alphaproteobacteria bacterium HGW-Alphaproteobacteria-16]